MKNIKNLSDLEVDELQTLIYRIKEDINDFMHVSDNLPVSITKAIDLFYDKLNKEADFREDQF